LTHIHGNLEQQHVMHYLSSHTTYELSNKTMSLYKMWEVLTASIEFTINIMIYIQRC